MKTPPLPHCIQAWQFRDVLLETYDYAPGKPDASERHIHADYQLCLSLDFPGVYAYRGANHAVPIGSLSVLHPGEPHASFDPQERQEHTHYCVFYVPCHWMQQAAREQSGQTEQAWEPFFTAPIVENKEMFRELRHLHTLLGSNAPLLEQESRLLLMLRQLSQRYTSGWRRVPDYPVEHTPVGRIKAYIEDHFNQSISLSELARLVERHPVYVHQMFQRSLGIPPHMYQTQVRIECAKRLLAANMPSGQVAQAVGFYDQSHFGRYFRRFTGTTPARYRALRSS